MVNVGNRRRNTKRQDLASETRFVVLWLIYINQLLIEAVTGEGSQVSCRLSASDQSANRKRIIGNNSFWVKVACYNMAAYSEAEMSRIFEGRVLRVETKVFDPTSAISCSSARFSDLLNSSFLRELMKSVEKQVSVTWTLRNQDISCPCNQDISSPGKERCLHSAASDHLWIRKCLVCVYVTICVYLTKCVCNYICVTICV